ncbi:response regulator [Flavobacterium sp. Sd200]|uniref:response regulator n=1 Tax=Flavobacterium sp. Sd200 TaxID=2692211 RepID=UPI00136D7B14|nr:response regulator [Flavobacterium sp. Sd200]MXN91334.1 response regulator [Flavobacterium sp. Sd200]
MKTKVCFLIDDDEDDREIFSLALEKATNSYSCITASSGPDALALLNADAPFTPDIIFLDLNMPLMPGKECLQHIKNNTKLANIPVIIYTTSSYSKDIDDTRSLGASHFLVKPPGLGILTRALKRLLSGEELPYFIDHSS